MNESLANPIAALWRVPLKKAVWDTDQIGVSSNNPSKRLESYKKKERKSRVLLLLFGDWYE